MTHGYNKNTINIIILFYHKCLHIFHFTHTGWTLIPPRFRPNDTPEGSQWSLALEAKVDDEESKQELTNLEGEIEWHLTTPGRGIRGFLSDEEIDELDMYINVSPTTTNGSSNNEDESSNAEDVEDDLLNCFSRCSPSPAFAILRVFEFDSRFQGMSVIIKNRNTGELKVYTKGSPERVHSVCVPSSIPCDWEQVLATHTEEGLRVLAIAQKTLNGLLSLPELNGLKREEVEKEMSFLGFLLFSNMLRPDSAGVIRELQESGCCKQNCPTS